MTATRITAGSPAYQRIIDTITHNLDISLDDLTAETVKVRCGDWAWSEPLATHPAAVDVTRVATS